MSARRILWSYSSLPSLPRSRPGVALLEDASLVIKQPTMQPTSQNGVPAGVCGETS